ncbi:MAG TPA: NADH-quinone oxidoreductase subunit A [Xanthobacteraceae bacterium]|nr:NADH-quinone oxidoreductase subunit A [Xanthobacteraceae bacterium]
MELLGSQELPLIVYSALVVFVTAAMLASYVLGQRHWEQATNTPYESGIVSEGSTHVRFSARFYLVAMFFVVFDLEAVFLFAWAVAAREAGWAGYWEVVIFIGVLVAALIYLWGVGALDWATERANRR